MSYVIEAFLVKGVLGYLVQCMACVFCVCACSRHKISFAKYAISSFGYAVLVYVLREFVAEKLNFGIHTVISMIILCVLSILYIKNDISPTILGSILSTVLILATEIVNIAFAVLTKGVAVNDVNAYLNSVSEIAKAWLAVPGNAVLLIVTGTLYFVFAVKKGKKAD